MYCFFFFFCSQENVANDIGVRESERGGGGNEIRWRKEDDIDTSYIVVALSTSIQ